MTHHEDDRTIARVMKTLISNGMESMGEAFGILYNAAMEMERAQFLGAGRYERCDNRIGLANGFKGKEITTRVGKIPLKNTASKRFTKRLRRVLPKIFREGNPQ